MGCSPCGRKELDTTERLTHTHTRTCTRTSPKGNRQTDGQVCSRETRPENVPIHPGFEGRPRRVLRGETLGRAQLSACVRVSVRSVSFELLHKHPQPLPEALAPAQHLSCSGLTPEDALERWAWPSRSNSKDLGAVSWVLGPLCAESRFHCVHTEGSLSGRRKARLPYACWCPPLQALPSPTPAREPRHLSTRMGKGGGRI